MAPNASRLVADTFDQRAATWAEKGRWADVRRGSDRPLDALAAEYAPPGAWVVDLGGGDGRFASRLAESMIHGTVVLVDLSPKMMEIAARNLAPLTNVQTLAAVADATWRLPLQSHRFDLVLLRQVLHHVSRPMRVLDEAHRVLRPGGALVLQVPGPGFLVEWVGYEGNYAGDALGRFSEDEVNSLLRNTGFRPHSFRISFQYRFNDLNHLVQHLGAVGSLDRFVGYAEHAPKVVTRLLSSSAFASILAKAAPQPFVVDCDYVVAVGISGG